MSPSTHHKQILQQIKDQSGEPSQHSFLDNYLGNDHPKYPIRVPVLRKIAKQWIRDHKELGSSEFEKVLTSLIMAPSSTEKCMAGILLDFALPAQRKFKPNSFDRWLNHLEGWVEVDTLCTGNYAAEEISLQWTTWKKILTALSKSKNINKRRASLVLFCTPLRKSDDQRLMTTALQIIDRLKHEKDILITKAVSWVLRSAITRHKGRVAKYLKENTETLPKIAVRETERKLRTGRK